MSYYMSSSGPTYLPSSATSEESAFEFPQNIQSSPQYNNYSGQVSLDQPQQMMTYTDSAGTPTIPHPPPAISPSPMSVLPSNQIFTGPFNFRFEFGKQPKDTKSTAWTYSTLTNKLYAQKDVMCPVKFAIDGDGVAHGLYIRALPVYSRPENLQDVVKRCPNHVQAPESASIPHREHFIWCENQAAHYVHDANTGRFAVRMPYDRPPAGTQFVTHLFSFKCLNSCVGGPNRREMSIIFTLENGNQEVLGRQSIDLRICACPGRDRKSDESKLDPSNKQFKGTTTPHSNPATTNTATLPPQQGSTTEPVSGTDVLTVNRPRANDSEIFYVPIRGKKNFDILSRIRDSLEMWDMVPTSDRERFIKQRRQNDRQYAPPSFRQPAPPAAPQQMPPQQTNRLLPPFSFTSARQFPHFIKQDLVDSTQRCGVDLTDGAPNPFNTSTSTSHPSRDISVAEWLGKLGLAAYVDNFHSSGLKSMSQLRSEQNFTMKDLENMMLTKATVTKIWNALKHYRTDFNPTLTSEPSVLTLNRDTTTLPDSQGSASSSSATLSPPNSQGSVVSLGGRTNSSGSTLFKPGQFEFTRCSIRFSLTKRKSTCPIQSTTNTPSSSGTESGSESEKRPKLEPDGRNDKTSDQGSKE